MKSRINYLLFTAIVFIFTSNVFSQVPNYVPTTGLVGYWPFNGNANDESGNGNNGLTGSGVALTTDRFLISNSAYDFNGSGNISLTSLPTMGSQDFSISGWIKTNNLTLRKGIACWGQDSPWNSSYFYITDNGYLKFDFAYNGGPQSPIFVADNNWHSVLVTCTSGLIQLYLDGAATGTALTMTPNISGSNKSIGANIDNSGSNNFIGVLDDIGIWNRALTQQEITNLYTSTVPVSCLPAYVPTSGLVGYWPFNGNANDESGNGFNMTLHNNVSYVSDHNGIFDGAINLVGQDATFGSGGGHAIFPSNFQLNSGGFSISIWVKTDEVYDAGESYIQFGLMQNPSGDVMIHHTFNEIAFRVGNATLNFFNANSMIGSWHNYIISYNGLQLSVYIDGNLFGVANNTNTLDLDSNMMAVGRHWWGSESSTRFVGQIDDISIYNRALTPTEITQIYTSQTSTVQAPCPTLATNLQNGLVGYWPFCGNANDESGNGNNGANNGATLTTDRNGNANSAYSFDGVNDFISNPTNGLPYGNTNRTVNCWIRKENNNSPWTHTAVSYGSSSQSNALMLGVGNNNNIVVQGWGDDIGTNFNNISYEWHMMTFTLNQGLGSVYYDGVLVASQAVIQWNTIQSSFYFGSRCDLLNSYFFGQLDDIGIWNRALTQQEITNLYTSTVPPTAAVLSGDATICAGASTNLSVAVTGGTAPYTVTVSDGTNNYSATGASPVSIPVSPTATSTYSIVSVTGGGTGTGNTGTATVTVIDATITASDSVICAGETVTLSVPQGGSSNTACAALPTNLQTGLVGYWPFCGNANDESGNGNNGTVNGATLTTDRFGNQNSAYSFSNNLISVPHNESLGIQQNGMQTVSAWINVVGNQSVQHLIGKRPNGAQQFNWQVSFNYPANQGLTYTGNLNFTNTGVVSNFNPQQNIWVHLVCVYNNGVWSIYVNGTLINSVSTGLFYPDVNCPLTFGNAGSFQPFYGTLDEIAIYNRALSLSEIQQLYTLDFNSYLWSTGATTPTINVTPTTTTTYTCTVTDVNGNVCTDSVTVFVPQIEATDLTICAGETTTLSVSGINSTATPSACPTLPINLQTGLVGYWPFCGNANDVSGNGNNGTVNGATLTTDRFGSANSAYSFDGNQYIDITSTNGMNSTNSISMSIWFNWAGPNSWSHQYFYQIAPNPNGSITIGNDGTLSVNVVNCNCPSDIGISTVITQNTWHHVVLTYDLNQGLMKMYLNGVLIGTSQESIFSYYTTNNPGDRFGCYHFNEYFFSGKLDDAGLWNKVLTQSEIQQIYNLGQTTYLWSTGATTASINVTPTQTTTYTCTTTTNGVSCTDSVTVVVNNPVIDLGADLTVCGTSTTLTAPAGYDSYSWSNGATTNTITVTSNGTYSCTVTQGGCSATDSIDVTLIVATISASNTSICSGEQVNLLIQANTSQQATTNSATELWFQTYLQQNAAFTRNIIDGNSLVVAGSYWPGWPGGTTDQLVTKLNCETGNLEWQHVRSPGGDHDGFGGVQKLANGNYIFFGQQNAQGTQYFDGFWSIYNPNGIEQSYGMFSVPGSNSGSDVQTLPNGNLIFSGNSGDGVTLNLLNQNLSTLASQTFFVGSWNNNALAVSSNRVYSFGSFDANYAKLACYDFNLSQQWILELSNTDASTTTILDIVTSGEEIYLVGSQTISGLKRGVLFHINSSGQIVSRFVDSNSSEYTSVVMKNQNCLISRSNLTSGLSVNSTLLSFQNDQLQSEVITFNGGGQFVSYDMRVDGDFLYATGVVGPYHWLGFPSATKLALNLNQNYIWSTGATTPSINVSPTTTTTYTCTITTNGVSCTDSVTVVVSNPVIDLGADLTVCGTSTTLTAPAGFDSYLWSNGATTNTTTVIANGIYSCTVTQGGCSATDSIDVTLIDATITASDSVICAGESVTLSVPQGGSSNTACAALPTNLQTGLVGYWPFCGNANDASGNGNNGTVNGATLTTDRFGITNSAYSFDGVDDYIQTNFHGIQGGASRSVSFWAKTSGNNVNLNQDNMNVLCYGGPSNGGNFEVALNHGCEGLTLDINNGVNTKSSVVNNDTWNYFTLVFNSLSGGNFNSVSYQKNSVLLGTTCQIGTFQVLNTVNNYPIVLGAYWDHINRVFQGKLDDIAIYNRVLTQAEIQQLYTLGQTTYLWSTGATTTTINVSPTSTTTYTCTTTINGVSCSSNYTITVNNSSASTNIVTAFDSFTWLDGNTYTASNNTATYTTTNAAGCDSVISLNLTITPSSPSLALQVFFDGYYINGSNPAAMTAARYNNLVASGSATPGAATDVDVITVELRSPSNLDVVAYSVSPILQTNGSVQCVFPAGALGGSYYIVVKHRATIPLWSANPVTLSSSSAFSFANNSSNSYSYGSITPIHTLVPSLFGIWLGELNDDGYLDGLDYPWFENDTYSSAYGGLYLLDGDFNGDSYVDASDYAVFDYNSTIGSYEQRPYAITTNVSIGQSYQGGIVAYILQAGDPGYDATMQHGLIAAPSDQGIAQWGCYGTEISGADATAIGTGAQNTIDILNGCSTAGIPARLCGDLVLGGFSDWYLPSKDELNKLYINRVAIGGFGNYGYWSSSEGINFLIAWGIDFSNTYLDCYSKNGLGGARAVRAF